MSGKRSPWAAFGALALIEFAAVMDASIVNIALPSIGRSLHDPPAMLTWVVDGYLTGLAGFMLAAGRATDLIGRRVLFLAGVAAFTAFSGACALAVHPWQLIVSRVGQGAGAALAMPSAIALITDLFPEGRTRNKALGMFSGMAGIAAPAGLVLGGALSAVSWRWIFLVNVPVGLIAITAGLRALPPPQRRAGTPVDLPGALALTGGLISLTLAILRGSAQGWGSAATLAQSGTAALLAAFGFRQASVGHPLIPRELLQSRAIVTGNLIFMLVGTILLGTFFITTLFLQQARELAPLTAALIYLPVPAAMLAGTQAAPRLLRLGPPNTLMGALALQAVALAGWALLMRPAGSLLLTFLLPATVWAFGLGLAIVSSFVVCTSGVSPQLAGAASGLATTAYQGGGAVGLALLALVATTRTQAAGAGPAALTTGFTTALWVSADLALTGAAATRIIARASAAPRDSNRHEAAANQLR